MKLEDWLPILAAGGVMAFAIYLLLQKQERYTKALTPVLPGGGGPSYAVEQPLPQEQMTM